MKESRQKEIIVACYKLAKKEGLENTSIAKIAQSMNINPSLIIHYFQTREELIYGLIDYMLAKYKGIFNVPKRSNKSAREILLEVIDHLFSKKWNALFDDSLFYGCFALTFRDHKIKIKYKVVLDELRKSLAELIEASVKEGSIQVAHPYDVADTTFMILDGAYFYVNLLKDPKQINEKLGEFKPKVLALLGICEPNTN